MAALALATASAGHGHDVEGQEDTHAGDGITAKASAGLSTPTNGQHFTGGAVYVTVASDSKHYVKLVAPPTRPSGRSSSP